MDVKTKREIRSLILDYLKKRVPNFTKKGKMFTCPKCKDEKLTANIFPENSGKVHCFEPACKFKGDIFDVARLLDYEGDISDEEIAEFLKEEFKIITNKDVEKLLEKYKGWGWDLVPIAHGAKNPIEKSWTEKSHKDIKEWQTWLESGLGLGCKTGKLSNITVIDIDKEDVPKSMQTLFEPTLVQRTKKGVHWIYTYEEEIPTGNFEIDGVHIDVQNDGRQIVIEPSIVDNYERKMSKNKTISQMNWELKKFLLEHLKTKKENIKENTNDVGIITGLEGNCNNTFVKTLGAFRKFMTISNVERCAYLMNQMLDDPMDNKAIKSMCRSIETYHEADIKEIANKIIEHMKIVNEVHVRDLKECLQYDRKDLEQALRFLCDHKKIIKIRKVLYKLIEDIEWQEDFLSLGKPLNFKVPYFEDYAYLDNSNLIIVGASSGFGKTTFGMNFIKQLVEQGKHPYLISTEAGSKFQKIAQAIGLKEGDFSYFITNDPLSVDLPQNAITVLDWLKPKDSEYGKTDSIYEKLNDKLVEKGGLLLALAQLKKDTNSFYAESMTEFFGALVAKLIYPIVNGVQDNLKPYLTTTKVRDSKVGKTYIDIPLIYNPDTRILELKK